MALFDLFGSKKPPVKKTVTVKAVPKRKSYAETAGVINTGVDVYSFAGTAQEYFAQVLQRNFPGYEIRRNVAFEEIYNESQRKPAPAPAPVNGWKCTCGTVCKGAFCPECGSKKPEPKPAPAGPWTCSCGSVNKGNFCPECGARRPVSNDWVCPVCGNKNKSKFCPVCGKAKPDQAAPATTTSVRSDEGPAVSFATLFEKGVQADIAKSRYPRLDFVIFKNGMPDVAILLSSKADYDQTDKRDAVNRLGLACRQKHIAFQRYFKEFRNDEAYICQRIREDLG